MAKAKTPKKSKKRREPPKVLHCSRCSFVTRTGIAGLMKHYRKAHPKALAKARKRGKK